jgi:putative addiction module killer protein/probable addiction module antidote protein
MELQYYQTASGRRPFVEWLGQLKDRQARWRIESRLAVVATGSLGDVKPIGDGLLELRIDWGPGYRVRLSHSDLLLCGETSGLKTRTSNVRKTTWRTSGARPKRADAELSLPYEDWLIEQLKDPVEAAGYLEAAIQQGDQGALMLALRHVAMAQGGISALARRAKLTREAAYRMLSESGNPELSSLNAILAASGLQLSVRPIARTPTAAQRRTRYRVSAGKQARTLKAFTDAQPKTDHKLVDRYKRYGRP